MEIPQAETSWTAVRERGREAAVKAERKERQFNLGAICQDSGLYSKWDRAIDML